MFPEGDSQSWGSRYLGIITVAAYLGLWFGPTTQLLIILNSISNLGGEPAKRLVAHCAPG